MARLTACRQIDHSMPDLPQRSAEILLVEDSVTDAQLAMKALERGRLVNNVHHVKDGVEALEFLNKQGKYADSPRPDVVLLDLNMPRMDGREVLAVVKADESLKTIPIVVLTTSDEESDIISAYGLSSNAYIVKPVDLKKFFDVVTDIQNFWFQVVTLPPAAPQ